jgi:hypothetical protein
MSKNIAARLLLQNVLIAAQFAGCATTEQSVKAVYHPVPSEADRDITWAMNPLFPLPIATAAEQDRPAGVDSIRGWSFERDGSPEFVEISGTGQKTQMFDFDNDQTFEYNRNLSK